MLRLCRHERVISVAYIPYFVKSRQKDDMKTKTNTPKVDFNDEDSNTSNNPTFDSVLQTRLSRRGMLKGGTLTLGSVLFGVGGLAACGSSSDDDDDSPETPPTSPSETLLDFTAVPKSLADAVIVPSGYTAQVLYALGDPLSAGVLAYRNDGTDIDFENRAGDHHDGMEWFGLGADNRPSASSTDRGLLAVNHEATTNESFSSFFLHQDGGTNTLPRPAAEVDKEVAIHGISVVEIQKTGNSWATMSESSFNFRLTALSEIEIAGPARGNPLLVTKYSPDATRTRGTLNNCGTGKSPWGTFLTGEENWYGYFTRDSADDAARGNDKSVTSLLRYGRSQGAGSRHGWESAGADDRYARWNISQSGTSADGSDDYRNEMNGQGYIVEIDPYDRSRKAKKRTALGRFAHESAAFRKAVAGQPIVVYMGDDARGEYIYKWVSAANWDPADADAISRMSAGDKYLDNGKLYAAKFSEDGTGSWLELSLQNPVVSSSATYPFADQADVAINARLAADAAGATKMDRPEWCGVNPANGEVYFALTNNTSRRIDPTGSQYAPDAANPRVYTDMKNGTAQMGNPNGHILRVRESSATGSGDQFDWDVYLFGAQADADAGTINLSNLTDDQDFSSPDGLVFSEATGLCWFQTDDGAYTDVTNCMMLAARPGQVGDGEKKSLNYTKADGSALTVDTYVGQPPAAEQLKRFLVGPVGCEITGFCETPDGKAIFVNIQHPGENTSQADIANPSKYTSQWPSNFGYGAGVRPRSATIVITKDDGGRIGT